MNPTRPIRVLLVDDHAMVRRGLTAFLFAYDDLELAGEAANGAEAIRCCEALSPDVVLMDILMPEMDGINATRQIHQRFPAIRIVALTSFPEEGAVLRALSAGATSFLLKNITPDELAAAIRAAAQGRPTLSTEATQALIHAASSPPVPGHDLSPREREVLALMVRGLSNLAIADRLVISRSTAKAHVSSILAKLGVTTRTEAVAMALQHHLVG